MQWTTFHVVKKKQVFWYSSCEFLHSRIQSMQRVAHKLPVACISMDSSTRSSLIMK